MRLFVSIAAVALALVASASARADEGEGATRFEGPITVITSEGQAITLPAGVFLTAPAFAKVDAEVIRLQEAETRLRAENASLLASLETPKWIAIASGALAVITVAIAVFGPQLRERVAPAP